MRKWGVLACVMLLAALCGCGRAETVWETVDDGLEQAAVQGGAPMEMVFDVPEGAEQIGLLDDCRVYAHPDGDYEITAQVLPGVDVGAVIRTVSGFAPEQLRAVVRQEGRELGRYPLSQDAQILLHTAEGYNLLVIEAGQAYIREADCPNGLCVQEGRVSRTGESLVCLPHRLTVTIEGGEEALDGVSG